jgi:hypothetical protein
MVRIVLKEQELFRLNEYTLNTILVQKNAHTQGIYQSNKKSKLQNKENVVFKPSFLEL